MVVPTPPHDQILFILHGSPLPFAPLTPIWLLHPFGPFLLPCSAQTFASPRLPRCFSEIACYLFRFRNLRGRCIELQSLYLILAPGLARRIYFILPVRFTLPGSDFSQANAFRSWNRNINSKNSNYRFKISGQQAGNTASRLNLNINQSSNATGSVCIQVN